METLRALIVSIFMVRTFDLVVLSWMKPIQSNQLHSIFSHATKRAFSSNLTAVVRRLRSIVSVVRVFRWKLQEIHVATRLPRSPIERESRRRSAAALRARKALEAGLPASPHRREGDGGGGETGGVELFRATATKRTVPARFHALRRP